LAEVKAVCGKEEDYPHAARQTTKWTKYTKRKEKLKAERRCTMSATVTLEEAQAHLAELVSKLAPGEEVVITDNQQPVVRLLPVETKARRTLGTMRGSITYRAPDFDAPLDDFKEYRE
jgi:prevent-host-death family protein